jgi:uncharacterized cupin superfamily protein
MTATPAPHPMRIDANTLPLHPLDLDPEDFQSPLPTQHYALIFEDEAIGLAVGIWDTTTMQEAFGPYPGDEYITVLDGGFAMVNTIGGTLAAAQAGQSVTFQNGTPSSWKQDGYLRKVYLTLQDPNGAVPLVRSAMGGFQVVGPGQMPNGSPDANGLTREVIFRNDAGTMTVALCAFPALTLPQAPVPTHCLIRVLQGTVTLTSADSPPEIFGPGAHVFLPKGTACGWAFAEATIAVLVDVTAE